MKSAAGDSRTGLEKSYGSQRTIAVSIQVTSTLLIFALAQHRMLTTGLTCNSCVSSDAPSVAAPVRRANLVRHLPPCCARRCVHGACPESPLTRRDGLECSAAPPPVIAPTQCSARAQSPGHVRTLRACGRHGNTYCANPQPEIRYRA